MNHYRIRVDAVEGFDVDGLLEAVQSTTHVTVRHELPHGNPHYHIYAVSEIKDANLRKRLKAKFPMLTKTDYSVKKCDEERINEYVQYMFNTKHGNRWELVNKSNFDDSILDGLMEAAKEVSAAYVQHHKQKKPTGPTLWDLAEQVTIEYNKLTLIGEDYDQKRIIAYTDCAIQVLRHNKKAFDEFLLRKLITTAMSESPKGKEMLRYKMLKNFCQI